MKEKISLTREMETLLIPLFGRAESTRQGLCSDTYAIDTLSKIEYDFDALKIPKKMRVLMAIRSGILDDFAREFLLRTPDVIVISLGSGLDARYARVGGYSEWVDLDFPEVVALREKLLPAVNCHRNIPSSVTDRTWLDLIPGSQGETLVIAEGLTMYLAEADVYGLFNRLADKFPNLTIIFDAFSKSTVRNAGRIPSLHKTGAAIRWGVDDPKGIERACEALKYRRSLYLTGRERIKKLDPFYRLAFRVASAFGAAREAHRVLIFDSKA